MLDDLNKKTLSDKWMVEVIYPALDKINTAYFRMYNGCSDVSELEYTTHWQMSEVKYINAGIFLTSLKFIILNGKALFKKDKHEELVSKIKELENFYTKYVGERIYKDIEQRYVFVLDEAGFIVLTRHIGELHKEVIDALESVLFLEGNIKYKR